MFERIIERGGEYYVKKNFFKYLMYRPGVQKYEWVTFIIPGHHWMCKSTILDAESFYQDYLDWKCKDKKIKFVKFL